MSKTRGRVRSMVVKIRIVAWREFKYTALTKAFLLGGVIFPLLIWTSFPLIIGLTKQTVPPLTGTVALIDPTGEVAAAARVEFDPVRRAAERTARAEEARRAAEEIARAPSAAADALIEEAEALAARAEGAAVEVDLELEEYAEEAGLGRLKDRVRSGDLLAAAVVDPAVLDPESWTDDREAATIDLFTDADMRPVHVRMLRARLGNAVVRARASRIGQDVGYLKSLVNRPRIKSVSLAQEGGEVEERAELKELLPFIFVALLVVCAFTSGQYLLTTTIEEKSNRVMEVLLGAVSPLELMAGKVAGQALVGLVMLVMYGSLGLAALVVFGTTDLVSMGQIACFIVYFAIAYFFTAAVMASIGSAVSDLHDAQTLMLPAMTLLLFLPMFLMFPASQNPTGLLATISSFVPPVIPYVMIVRITAEEIPPLQIVLSMIVGAGSVAGALWVAAKIFRVGVLMYGKPPSPLEMLKWMRYS